MKTSASMLILRMKERIINVFNTNDVMNIGLIDVDGHNFPNLALMKLSAYHKTQGDTVEWYSGIEHYDKVYMSKVFTFTPDDGRVIQANEVVRGGTGYNIGIKVAKRS